jgi:hypothetical protein
MKINEKSGCQAGGTAMLNYTCFNLNFLVYFVEIVQTMPWAAALGGGDERLR